jgi:hypothetical protein
MQALNPKSPDELEEEQEEQEFLNGGQSHEHAQHEHHWAQDMRRDIRDRLSGALTNHGPRTRRRGARHRHLD